LESIWGGQGLIPEAVRALLKRSFRELPLSAVWCCYYEGNHKSRRVCEKCGFVYHHANHAVISPLGDKRTEHFCRMTIQNYDAMLSAKRNAVQKMARHRDDIDICPAFFQSLGHKWFAAFFTKI